MIDPVTISILIVACVNALVAIFSAIKEDHFSSACCTSKNGSSLFKLDNDFKGNDFKGNETKTNK